MEGILSNLKMKIVAWVIATSMIVVIGIFVEEHMERQVAITNGIEYVSDGDFDDLFEDYVLKN